MRMARERAKALLDEIHMLFIVIVFIIPSCVRVEANHGVDGLSYWKQRLPHTPIPRVIQQSIIQGNMSYPTSGGILDQEEYPVRWCGKRQTVTTDQKVEIQPGVLFLKKNLYPGGAMEPGLKLARINAIGPRRFMVTRADADTMPFSYNRLNDTLRSLQILPGSEMAAQVITKTLLNCEEEGTDNDEPWVCATSIQATIDVAVDSLGSENLQAAATVMHSGDREPDRYVVAPDGVTEIARVGVPVVACHRMPYPYMVFYCHHQQATQTFRVQLIGVEDGLVSATAIAVCHMDTSNWDDMYFKLLGALRGESICHFMPQPCLLWMKN